MIDFTKNPADVIKAVAEEAGLEVVETQYQEMRDYCDELVEFVPIATESQQTENEK